MRYFESIVILNMKKIHLLNKNWGYGIIPLNLC